MFKILEYLLCLSTIPLKKVYAASDLQICISCFEEGT